MAKLSLGFSRNRYVAAAIAVVMITAVVLPLALLKGGKGDKGAPISEPGESGGIGNAGSKESALYSGLKVKPVSFDSAGVDLDSSFKITSEKELDEAGLKAAVSTRPAQPFSIRGLPGTRKEFLLKFEDPMLPDTVYRIQIDAKKLAGVPGVPGVAGVSNAAGASGTAGISSPLGIVRVAAAQRVEASVPRLSWAFQTKKEFRVVRTLPRNEGTGVPANSGIEITFSHDGVEGLEEYFEITPDVKGWFEYHRRVAVFVPEKLEYDTIYTVTIKKGLGLKGSAEKLKEDYVFSFQTQSEEEKNANYNYFGFNKIMYNFKSTDMPVLNVYSSDYYTRNEIAVNVYSYADVESLKKDVMKYNEIPPWASRSPGKIVFEKQALKKELSFKTTVKSVKEPIWREYIVFPTQMSEGYYLVEVQAENGKTYWAHVQVNDMVVYIIKDKSSSLIWVNDSITGKPLEGVTIRTDGTQPGQTGGDGVAVLKDNQVLQGSTGSNKYQNYKYYTLEAPGRAAFLAMASNADRYYYGYGSWFQESPNTRYWSYLYLDRGVYLPDDVIRFWGLVKPRGQDYGGSVGGADGAGVGKNSLSGGAAEGGKGSASAERKVAVELVKYTYNRYSTEKSVLESKELPLSDLGTFSGEIGFSNLNPGGYSMVLRIGEDVIEQMYISINKYTKPAYKIEATSDKDAIMIGEQTVFNVQASFFEGSPVSGLAMNYKAYSYYGSSDYLKQFGGKLTCGKDGSATLVYAPQPLSTNRSIDWRPFYINVNFENAAAEEQYVIANKSVLFFPRDVMIEARGEIKAVQGNNRNIAYIELASNKIDVEKYRKMEERMREGNAHEFKGTFEDMFRGPEYKTTVRIRLFETYYKREPAGSYYDYINKVKRDYYTYSEITGMIGEADCITEGGKALCELPIEGFSENKSYYAEISAEDSQGRAVKFRSYLFRSSYNPYYYGMYGDGKYYEIKEETKRTKFVLGDAVLLYIAENGKKFKVPKNGRTLFITLKNGLKKYEVKESSGFAANFSEDLIPNAFVRAVYFDGANVYGAGEFCLYYDYTEKELSINVRPEAKSVASGVSGADARFRPGGAVSLDIEVKDKSGNPCEAEVSLSVVDEAFFALFNQQVNTAGGVYNYVFGSGITDEYYSNMNAVREYPMAECGEGGDRVSTRFHFKDNAYFGTVRTNKDGKAKIAFTLPHNITSWRITSQGITSDLKAGHSVTNIDASLPFFTAVIFNDVYLKGDSPGISLRSFGSAIVGNEAVYYEVAVEGPEGKTLKFAKEGVASSFCNINLGSLEPGEYSITARASCGSYRDAVKKSFRVVESMLEAYKVEYFGVSEGLDIASSINVSEENSLVQIDFYNKGISEYYRALLDLCGSWGSRVDQVLARKKAGELLKKYFVQNKGDAGTGFYSENTGWGGSDDGDDESLLDYQTAEGGIALLKYDSADPELSAKVCSLAAGSFDAVDLEMYFRGIAEGGQSPNAEIAAAYWGLAALGKPVLLDVKSFLEEPGIGVKEKFYLGTALAELGDFAGAWEVYAEILSQYGTNETDKYMYINAGQDAAFNLETTALCSILAIKLGAPEKNKLFNYICVKSSNEILTNLEKLEYLLSEVPHAKSISSFAAIIGGKEEKISLEGIERHSIVLSLEKLKNLKFKNVEGNVEAAVKYISPMSVAGTPGEGSPKPYVSIKRTYNVNGKSSEEFRHSDVVEVCLEIELDEAAPRGFYLITDVLPSGLRYIPPREWGVEDWRLAGVNGQKVMFGYYYSGTRKPAPAIYRARVATTGVYTADSAAVSHLVGQFGSFAPRQTVRIVE